VLKVLVVL